MSYSVYILYSREFDKYYIGQTQDVSVRLERHNRKMEKATAPYVPWELAGVLEKPTRSEAMVLEKKLKNLNRERLKAFLEKYCSGG